MDASWQVLARLMRGTRCMCSLSRRRLHTVFQQSSYRRLGINQVRQAANLSESFKTSLELQQTNLQTVCRTPEDNPLNHSKTDHGLHYGMPQDMQHFLQKAFPVEFKKQIKTFHEAQIMVRDPALEVMTLIRQVNLDYPATRIVLYGRRGSGRTMTLAHVLHYCLKDQWVVIHVPWPSLWNHYQKEVTTSSHKPDRIDMPVEATDWLLTFRSQNQHLLQDLKTHSSYYWTKRESAEVGLPLLNILEFGVSRPKFAADCVGVLLKELKQHATEKSVKMMVAIDGVNALWGTTGMKTDDHQLIPSSRLSLMHNFKKILQNDWTNGVIVCTVDETANARYYRKNHTPHYLLGKEGFEWLDPFIPVLVPYYTDKEAYSSIEYFLSMNWLQSPAAKTEDGKKELIFLSNKNPYLLTRLCASR